MGLMSKDEILAADDLKVVEVSVPEWSGTVRVRELSAAAVFEFWNACKAVDGSVDREIVQSSLLRLTIVDSNNQPMFSKEDIDVLMAKSSAALGRIFVAAQRINGMLKEEDAVKN